ncbi:MAG: SDR family oxidoreductase [Planctomycetia bacterium]|nr:SDR family oxidoreductase [Planctomycetia bacterium]
MLDPPGKIAVVTGASRGLGRSVAIGLAKHGAKLAIVARNENQLRETAHAIKAAGGIAMAFPADVSRPEAVDDLHTRVQAELGTAQILINAAGVFGPIQLVHQSDPERWIETLAINTIGPYLTCRAFVEGMLEHRWGRIVNFSSAASLHPPGPLNSAYGTSKVALNQFTRHLAAELASSGVTANVIHPGEVKTEMWAAIREESQTAGPVGEGYRAWAEQVGQSGGDDPQKAVDLVLKLLDDKSGAINGQFLWIADGQQKPIPSW